MIKGRPKEFKLDTVLDRAMLVFWQHGYEATSMRDLVARMGINRASLYTAFGDKERLFVQVIDYYVQKYIANDLAVLEAESDPKQGVSRMFDQIVKRLTDPTLPQGCLIANTSVEVSNGSKLILRKIFDCISEMEVAFYNVLRKAQIDGYLAFEEDARALARFFTGAIQGMAVLAKTYGDSSMVWDMAKVSQRVWFK